MSGDCANAQPVCDDASIISNPNGSGYNDDIDASNWGTLINGEHFSNWVHFKTQVDCDICVDITNPNKIDYDFAIWDGQIVRQVHKLLDVRMQEWLVDYLC